MATEYLCKACRGVLNVKTSIILAALKNNSSKKGTLFAESRAWQLHSYYSFFFQYGRRRRVPD